MSFDDREREIQQQAVGAQLRARIAKALGGVDARLRARVSEALGGGAREICRWLNWQPHTFGHSSELIERHRQHGTLPDDVALDFVRWVAVGTMRNLAEAILGTRG